MSLRVVPVSWQTSQEFVGAWHRTHSKPPRGYKFCVGVATSDDLLVGIAIVGRPIAAGQQDGLTLEVRRTTTTGYQNANSMLYGASARGAKALGWGRVITYTQDGETGASLRAAGWTKVADIAPSAGWDRLNRPRADHGNDHVGRELWQRICNQNARHYAVPARPDDPARAALLAPTLWEAAG